MNNEDQPVPIESLFKGNSNSRPGTSAFPTFGSNDYAQSRLFPQTKLQSEEKNPFGGGGEEQKLNTVDAFVKKPLSQQSKRTIQFSNRSYHKLNQQKSIEKENIRMFKMIHDADSSVKKHIDLKNHKMKIKSYLNRPSVFQQA